MHESYEVFAKGLGDHLRAQPVLSPEEKHVLEVIDAPPTVRRTIALRRLERHVRLHLEMDGMGQIDWSKVDWSKVFSTVLKIVMALLPILLAL